MLPTASLDVDVDKGASWRQGLPSWSGERLQRCHQMACESHGFGQTANRMCCPDLDLIKKNPTGCPKFCVVRADKVGYHVSKHMHVSKHAGVGKILGKCKCIPYGHTPSKKRITCLVRDLVQLLFD